MIIAPETDINWPPAYRIKVHKQAKHVKLKTSKVHGLEIVLPYYFNVDNIPSILEENKDWIMRQLLKMEPISHSLPDTVLFNSINETWTVQYMASKTKLKIIERPAGEIALVGEVHDIKRCKLMLTSWAKEKAKKYLSHHLNLVSLMTQLSFQASSVRQQKSRWGSCTSLKTISLNYKLIFLPPALVNHVLIHELCHTKHLNHSKKFWQLVALHDPYWKKHRQELKSADQFIPAWLEM